MRIQPPGIALFVLLGGLLWCAALAVGREPAPVVDWSGRNFAISYEFRHLQTDLRLANHPPAETILARHLALKRELSAQLASGETEALAARFGAFDALTNELLRFDSTAEFELDARGRFRLLAQPQGWRVLEGGTARFPLLIHNRSGRPAALVLTREGGAPLAWRLGDGHVARELLEISASSATSGETGDTLRIHLIADDAPPQAFRFQVTRVPSTLVHVVTTDEHETPTPTRLRARGSDGLDYRPQGARGRLTLAGRPFAYGEGEFWIRLPHGPATLTFVHGFEYRVQEVALEVKGEAEMAPVRVQLARWIDMPARGWYAGDGHVHMNYGDGPILEPDEAFLQQRAEDVHVVNALVANWRGDDVRDAGLFEGRPHALSTERYQLRWNEEYRSSRLGHLVLYGLDALTDPLYAGFAGSPHPYDFPPNADIAAQAIAQGATVTGAHPSWTTNEHLLDIALGRVHGLEIAGYGAKYVEGVRMVQSLWNVGYRTVLSAGTDAMLNRIQSNPMGGARTYVRVAAPFSEASWVAGLRAGRSFVSTGPMLELHAGALQPGDELQLDAPETVRVVATARSQWPLSSLQLFHDGALVARATSQDGTTTLTLEHDLAISTSGWIAAQCVGPANEYVFGGPSSPMHPQVAHTSAIWVSLDGQPPPASPSADRIARAMADFAGRTVRGARLASPAQRAHLEATYAKAQAMFADERTRVGGTQ